MNYSLSGYFSILTLKVLPLAVLPLVVLTLSNFSKLFNFTISNSPFFEKL